jgi:addiction module HigA family antidote
VSPGAVFLERFLRPLGMTQREAAERLGISYPRMNEIVNGKRSVTPETALRLARFSGTEPAYWLELQLARDLWDARARVPPADLGAIEPAVSAETRTSRPSPQSSADVPPRVRDRAVRYGVARVFTLGEEPDDGRTLGRAASERLAMVDELTRQAWELSRAPRRERPDPDP